MRETYCKIDSQKDHSQVSRGVKRNVNITNERPADQRALLLQNPNITDEKQCLLPLLQTTPYMDYLPFYKKILNLPLPPPTVYDLSKTSTSHSVGCLHYLLGIKRKVINGTSKQMVDYIHRYCYYRIVTSKTIRIFHRIFHPPFNTIPL